MEKEGNCETAWSPWSAVGVCYDIKDVNVGAWVVMDEQWQGVRLWRAICHAKKQRKGTNRFTCSE